MSGAGAQWCVGGASVRGAAHERRGTPNQDAIGWRPLAGGGRQVSAAVADGHGAVAHFRSDVGARIAVESANAVLDWFLAHGGGDPATLPGETVEAWQAAVREHAAAVDGWVDGVAETLLPYGATLLALAAGDAGVTALQIGDGDLLLGWPDGRVGKPLPDDAGLHGEQTYSLCAPDAVCRFRLATLGADVDGCERGPDFALLATDGVGKSFGTDAGLLKAAGEFRAALLRAPMADVVQSLPQWLDELSRRGSGDDATLCLAIRQRNGD